MTCRNPPARHGGTILLLAAAALALFPSAHAQNAATLILEPDTAEPGAIVIATFTAPPTLALADLAVQERVTCALTGPDGQIAACDLQGAPIDASVLSDGRTYTIPLAAPVAPGAYEMRVTRTPIGAAPALAAEATTTLTIVAPEPVETGKDETDPSPASTSTTVWNIFFGAPGAGAKGAPDAKPDAADDAARWMVSATAGTGTLLLLLVGSRGGLGGTP